MLILLYSLHRLSILYFRLEGFFAFLRVYKCPWIAQSSFFSCGFGRVLHDFYIVL